MGPRWIEIDTDALRHNLRQIKGFLAPPCRLLAVVKADAYGLGAVEAARIALEEGASMLGVSLLSEALELRRHGISAPILVFAPPLASETRLMVANGLAATVTHPDTARALAGAAREVGLKAKVHLKVDTGLGRLGVPPAGVPALLQELGARPELELEGVYSHLSPHSRLAAEQAAVFVRVRGEVEKAGWQVPLYHLCSSFGLLRYPQFQADMVRIGTLLYGQWPAGVPRPFALQDPWRVKARLLQVRELPAGSRIGYGWGTRLSRPCRLGVVAVGLADGWGMEPSRWPEGWWELAVRVARLAIGLGRGYRGLVGVEVNGTMVPVLGRLSMQLAVVDLSAAGAVFPGQEVAIRGLRRTAASARLPRLYLSGGRAYRLRTSEGWVELEEEGEGYA
ncbi:MAG: alanine racemase [Moorellales bacterium]